MLARTSRFGNLVFDRDAIVHAALRAYVESFVALLPNCLGSPAVAGAFWEGDLQRGALLNDNGCGDYEVVAWTEAGVVGLAFELGWGPIEQLGLSLDAVTRGPDDVRGAVPGLPTEFEAAFVMAADMLANGEAKDDGVVYGEKLAGVGFWLYGDRVGGTLFDDPLACGANRLAAWGMLRSNRLPLACNDGVEQFPLDPPRVVPIQAVIDAVTDRALKGPTEFTVEELATICPTPPDPKRLLYARYCLQKVGITWPGLPEVVDESPYPY